MARRLGPEPRVRQPYRGLQSCLRLATVPLVMAALTPPSSSSLHAQREEESGGRVWSLALAAGGKGIMEVRRVFGALSSFRPAQYRLSGEDGR